MKAPRPTRPTVPVLAKARPTPDGSGSMFATIGRSAAPGRPPRSSITRAIVAANIRRRIWRDIPASCKQTPMTATTSCISQTGSPGRSGRRRAGCMRGARSSPWPTSRRTRAAKLPVRRRSRSRRSPSRWCAASTRCLRSSARSTARAPRSALAVRRVKPAPGRRSQDLHARAGGEAVARARPRQGNPVHAQAQAGFHAIPRRRARLHVEQCRRAWAARRRDGAFIVHLIFKCLETLEVAPSIRSDTGVPSARSPR